jgi:hypothetical protein
MVLTLDGFDETEMTALRAIWTEESAMQIERFHMNADRYLFDFDRCTYAKGWAQLDTPQDASYFGNWVNPTELKLCSYTEGDVTITTCTTAEEFAAEVRRACEWYAHNDGKPGRIDPGFGEDMKARFEALGLGDVLH